MVKRGPENHARIFEAWKSTWRGIWKGIWKGTWKGTWKGIWKGKWKGIWRRIWKSMRGKRRDQEGGWQILTMRFRISDHMIGFT